MLPGQLRAIQPTPRAPGHSGLVTLAFGSSLQSAASSSEKWRVSLRGITRDSRMIQLSVITETVSVHCASRFGAPVNLSVSRPLVGRNLAVNARCRLGGHFRLGAIGTRLDIAWDALRKPHYCASKTVRGPLNIERLRAEKSAIAQHCRINDLHGHLQRRFWAASSRINRDCAPISGTFAPDLTSLFYARRISQEKKTILHRSFRGPGNTPKMYLKYYVQTQLSWLIVFSRSEMTRAGKDKCPMSLRSSRSKSSNS